MKNKWVTDDVIIIWIKTHFSFSLFSPVSRGPSYSHSRNNTLPSLHIYGKLHLIASCSFLRDLNAIYWCTCTIVLVDIVYIVHIYRDLTFKLKVTSAKQRVCLFVWYLCSRVASCRCKSILIKRLFFISNFI